MTCQPPGWVAAGASTGASAGAASCCYQSGAMIVGSLTPKTGGKVPTIFGSPAASCCYQPDEITVRDPAPKTGPDPARSSILECARPACCCYRVGGDGPAAPALPILLLSDLGGELQRFLLLLGGGCSALQCFLLLSGSDGAVAAGWRRTLITCVTAVHFVDLVTTFRGELPVTSGHFGYKVRLGMG